MPEIVEVRTIADCLQCFVNYYLIKAEFLSRYQNVPHQNYLPNAQIAAIGSHGKMLYWVLRQFGYHIYIIFNLGMEGKFLLVEENHTRVKFTFTRPPPPSSFASSREETKEEEPKSLFFDESRPFGRINIYLNAEEFNARIVGYDMLQQGLKLVKCETTWNDACWQNFYANCRQSSLSQRMIYEHLVKQNHDIKPNAFLGIGNWLKSEILHASKISPYRTLGSLSDAELTQLYYWMIHIMLKAYGTGGATFKSYKAPDGKKGSYVFSVYKRQQTPDGYPVIAVRIKESDQTTYWVKEVQV